MRRFLHNETEPMRISNWNCKLVVSAAVHHIENTIRRRQQFLINFLEQKMMQSEWLHTIVDDTTCKSPKSEPVWTSENNCVRKHYSCFYRPIHELTFFFVWVFFSSRFSFVENSSKRIDNESNVRCQMRAFQVI